MRFEVPQFIEVEDKIVGPFTWKQFIYLAGGAGVVIISFVMLPFFLFVVIGLPVAALAGFLAFHEVNNRPFSLFLESFVHYMTNTKLYLWQRKEKQVVREEPAATPVAQKTAVPSAPTGKEKIPDLSRKLVLNSLEDEKQTE